jgi:hypothetical protein
MCGYWKRVAGRAFYDTLVLFGWHKWKRLWVGPMTAAAFFAILSFLTRTDPNGKALVMEELTVWQAGALAILALGYPVCYSDHYILYPVSTGFLCLNVPL